LFITSGSMVLDPQAAPFVTAGPGFSMDGHMGFAADSAPGPIGPANFIPVGSSFPTVITSDSVDNQLGISLTVNGVAFAQPAPESYGGASVIAEATIVGPVTSAGEYSTTFTFGGAFQGVPVGTPIDFCRNCTDFQIFGMGTVVFDVVPSVLPLNTLYIAEGTYTFKPLEPAALLAQVTGVGPGKSLADKVSLAQTYFSANDIPNTCAQLASFVNEVNAQKGKSISQSLAAQLISDAQIIQAAIGCGPQ